MAREKVPPCAGGRRHDWGTHVSYRPLVPKSEGIEVIDGCSRCSLHRVERHYRTPYEGERRIKTSYREGGGKKA